jgi:hypothetical protein
MEGEVQPGALPFKTQTSVVAGKRPSRGALPFSSTHIEMRMKEIPRTTTSRSVPIANLAK